MEIYDFLEKQEEFLDGIKCTDVPKNVEWSYYYVGYFDNDNDLYDSHYDEVEEKVGIVAVPDICHKPLLCKVFYFEKLPQIGFQLQDRRVTSSSIVYIQGGCGLVLDIFDFIEIEDLEDMEDDNDKELLRQAGINKECKIIDDESFHIDDLSKFYLRCKTKDVLG
jgi:hypothetical protein